MKVVQRTVGAALLSAAILTNTGCYTTMRFPGGDIPPIIPFIAGAIIGRMTEEQRASMQQQYPQTWAKIQQNDAAANTPPATQGGPSSPGGSNPPAAPAPTAAPLTVDDVKAMSSSGIKSDVIKDEIKQSNTHFSQQDIEAAQQSTPPLDASVIDCMRQTMTS